MRNLAIKSAIWLGLSIGVALTIALPSGIETKIAMLVGVHLGIMHTVRLAGPVVGRMIEGDVVVERANDERP